MRRNNARNGTVYVRYIEKNKDDDFAQNCIRGKWSSRYTIFLFFPLSSIVVRLHLRSRFAALCFTLVDSRTQLLYTQTNLAFYLSWRELFNVTKNDITKFLRVINSAYSSPLFHPATIYFVLPRNIHFICQCILRSFLKITSSKYLLYITYVYKY